MNADRDELFIKWTMVQSVDISLKEKRNWSCTHSKSRKNNIGFYLQVWFLFLDDERLVQVSVLFLLSMTRVEGSFGAISGDAQSVIFFCGINRS
jgi:hypothetical protein